MIVMAHVIVLSDRPGVEGVLLHDTALPVASTGASLADDVVASLRRAGVTVEEGDALFFPDAAPYNRLAVVQADGTTLRGRWGTES